MSNCTSVFHSIPKVHKIIKELVYGNVADGRRLANLINSDKFKQYCLNDNVAKTDNLENINTNTLKRLINNFRKENIFSVNATTKVDANSGFYNMRSQAAYNTAITYAADVIKAINKKLTKEDLKDNNFYSLIINKSKKSFKSSLIARANSYGNKFDLKTPLIDIVTWMNNNEVSEQDLNYCDFVQSVFGANTNIWSEIFLNPKLSDINDDFNIEDEELKSALMNDEVEDEINDVADNDETDESTKQWEFGNNIASYTNLISKEIKDYFDGLVRLNSTVVGEVEKKGKKIKTYDQDKNNPLGVITTHNYQECIIELADIMNNYGGWINNDVFIEEIIKRANNKQNFAAFIRLANDMKNDTNFANAVRRDINKYIVDCIEVTITPEGKIESVQSNTSNNPTRKLFFNLRNNFKSSCIQVNNEDIKNEIDNIKELINQYNTSSKAPIVKSSRRSINVEQINVARLDEIIRGVKEIYRYYFPSLNDLSIDNFINKNNDTQINNITKLLAQLSSVYIAAKNSSIEKQKRDFEISKIRRENKKREIAAIETGQDKSKVKYLKEPEFNDDWIRGIDSPLDAICKMLSPYSDSKAELNSRTVDGNLSSDMLYNNYLFNICKVLSNPETLNLWVEERLRSKDKTPSTEYAFSNIIFEDEKLGIKGLVRKKENGGYELTEYGTNIVSTYLVNGVTNQMTGTNAKYTNMSDGDYYLLGLYAFLKPTKTYKKYNLDIKDMTVTTPYMMRTPSDAPKNFMVTLPKYSINGFWDYDDKKLNSYVDGNFSKYDKTVEVTQNVISNIKNGGYKPVKLAKDELADFVINTPKEIQINNSNAIQEGDTNRIVFETIGKDGIGYIWFDCEFSYNKAGKLVATNLNYLGKQSNGISKGDIYDSIESDIKNKLKLEYIEKHEKDKRINRNHPLFNLYYNVIRKELLEYLQAEEDIKRLPKSKLIEWYHYNPRKKGISGGNVFNFSLLDNNYGMDSGGNTIDERIKEVLASSSTGGQSVSLSNDYNNPITISAEADEAIKNIINDWLIDYIKNEVNDIKELYGQFITEAADYELEEFALNHYIANIEFDDLFEGNQKYYKDAQTFLKRAKEIQAGGTSYSGIDYLNTATYRQSVTETGDIIKVGGKEIKIRTGWNAITIHNSSKPSSNKNILYNKLKKVVNKDKAKEIAGRFGHTEEDGENNATTTKVNDAQSYITIYEMARRVKLMGLYPKYEKLLNQLTDDVTSIDEININELDEFIQVQKNFYYDHYYDENLKRHVSRQIKNAELVLVPKFLGENTSLGKLAKIMIENDIDQVNTQETSKAVNYDVIDFWDNDGNMLGNVEEFTKRAIETKKPFSYMYLYRQQEVPQHIIDAKNKAGIQVMKKILDNGVEETKVFRDNFTKAYVQNIKEDFDALMETFGIKFDKDYNIVSADGGEVNFDKIYKAALKEASRLGVDSNMLDYFMIRNGNQPTMPNYMNIVASKIESIAQSQFNKFITRQKLPGWHAAQVTSVGLEGLIKKHKQLKKGESIETDEGKRIELNYHKDDNVVEILLPKWAKSMFNQYDENGNLIKEIKIEDVDEDVLKCIGYRIPTEGKQSMAVMKVVGFLPDWMGSTIVVPDEWVTQTGSDFDVDSVYGISYETYLGSDGRVHKVEYIDGKDEQSSRKRYINYARRNGVKVEFTKVTKEDKEELKENINLNITSANKELLDKLEETFNDLMDYENEVYQALPKEDKNFIKEHHKNTKGLITFTQSNEDLIKYFKLKANAAIEIKIKNIYNQIADVYQQINDFVEYTRDANYNIFSKSKEIYNEKVKDLINKAINLYNKAIEDAAVNEGLMTYEEFSSQSVEAQNSRKARNNRIVDSMIAIMNHKSSIAENLSCSNFDDISDAIKQTDKLFESFKFKPNVNNPLTQIKFRRNAMSGATLKAFSVSRDTGNSVFNVSRAQLTTPIKVKYSNNVNMETVKEAFNVDEETGLVEHKGLANSKNDKNVTGEYITVASSHTTAHILDAIKEGAIPNENEYTFAAFKTLFDVGMDAYSAILWLRQPGITRIVDAYFESQSVFTVGQFNPIHTAVKRIAKELGIKVNKQLVNDFTPIGEVLTALNNEYGEQFRKIYPNSLIRFDNNTNSDVLNINIPAIENRIKSEDNTYNLLFDLGAIINFNHINNVSKIISNHIRVLNPDKFGAKQTIYETNKVIENIKKLYDSGEYKLIINENNKPIIDCIYPGLIFEDYNPVRNETYNNIDFEGYLANTEESAYPSLNAFMKYSTVPSIMINRQLFDTESDTFIEAVNNIEKLINGKIDKALYTDFKKYILDELYKNSCNVLTKPIKLNKQGNIEIDIDTEIANLEGSSPVEDEASKEIARIYGYGYSTQYDINIENVAKPTDEEIETFAKLTPGQKVEFVQSRLLDSERSIFDYIKVNLYDERQIRKTGDSIHNIIFDDQQKDMETIYRLFQTAFNNSNPLIRLTMIDIIKYAFVVEGYQFRKGTVSKIIKNDALYKSIEDGGTGIIDSIKGLVNNINYGRLEANNTYEDYIRSHSTIRQIGNYRIRYTNNKPNIYALTNGSGMYMLSTTDKTKNVLKEMKLINEHSDGRSTKYYINSRYININNRNKSTLYYVYPIDIADDNKVIYLIPLNKLEANEHGEFSVNQINNKYPNKEYYFRLIDESRSKNIPFNRLKDANAELYSKEFIDKFKAKKINNKEDKDVPENDDFLIRVEDSATKQMIAKINNVFANSNINNYWFYNGSFALKNAFKTVNKFSEQVIYDETGAPQKYLIKRLKFKNLTAKVISDNESLAEIQKAKEAGLKTIDGVYYVQRYEESSPIEEYVAEDDVHFSGVDTNIDTTPELSELTDVAHQFIVDIKSRQSSDKEANRVINNFHEYNIDINLKSSINERAVDVIKRSASYYASKAIEIQDKINNFYIDELDNKYDILSDKVISLIKENDKIRKEYINLILAASTFGNNFPLIKEISDNNLDDLTKRNINTIKKAITDIANDTKIKKAFNLVAVEIFQAQSSNPNFDSELTDIVNYIVKDASTLDSLFQDAQELAIPIIQVVLKHANNLVHQRNLEGKETIKELKRKLKEIREEARAKGEEINTSHIVDEKGYFTNDIKDKFYEDYAEKIKALNEAKEKGINSKEYIKAKFEKDKWFAENTEQKYIDDYYKAIIANEETMIKDDIIDYYIKYKELIDKRNNILRKFKNNRTKQDIADLKEIRTQIALMRDTYDYVTGDMKYGIDYKRAEALDNYINKKSQIQKQYFTSTARPGFENELQHYLDIINKYRKFDASGKLITSEDVLILNDEYANAIEWLSENTIYDIGEDIRKEMKHHLSVLSNKDKDSQYKNILNKIDEPYDSNGVIIGTKFNENQIKAIKEQQERNYKAKNQNADSRLIRNKSNDDRVFSQEFYSKFSDGNKETNKQRNKIVEDINKILIKTLDDKGKINLSVLNIDELRKLNELYDILGNYKTPKSEKVKAFIKNDVQFYTDREQWAKDKEAAEAKGKEYYNVWKTLANKKNYADGILIGYANEPNSMIFGYVSPKLDKNGNVIKKEYYDEEKEESIKYIKEHIKFIPTKYYYQTVREWNIKGDIAKNESPEAYEQWQKDYAEWEENNHIYNPTTKEKEPIRIWTKVEYVGYGNEIKFYQPNYENTIPQPLPGVENENYNGVNEYNYKNKEYKQEDIANESERKYRKLMRDTIYNLTKDNPTAHRFAASGRFPRKAKAISGVRGVKKALLNFAGFMYNTSNENSISDFIGYERSRTANIPMLELLKDGTYKKPEKIREQLLDESDEDYAKYVKDTKQKNEDIAKYNKELDAKLMDRDYEAVFEEFVTRAIDANAKDETKIELYYLLEYLRKYYKGYDVTTFGNLRKDKRNSLEDEQAYKQKVLNNAIKVVEVWSKRFLFDEYKIKARDTKLTSVLQNVASSKYMMFNITGGISNVLTGSTNIFMERFAGEYFNIKDWEEAKFNYYIKSIPSFVINSNKNTSNNLTDAVIKLMGIVDYADVVGLDKSLNESNTAEIINKLKNYAYTTQTAGEHFMQNTAMLTMMISHRIYSIDGKVTIGSFNKYTRDVEKLAMKEVLKDNKELLDLYNKFINRIKTDKNVLKDYMWFKKDVNTEFLRSLKDKNIGFEYNKVRKEMLDKAKDEFYNNPRVIDQFELVDGYAQIKKDSLLNFKMLAEFKGKVVSVNKKIHGVYDKLGGASIESTSAWGGVIMQYHKHIYTGTLKRWRINGYYNESRETIEKGFYVSMWNFATTEFKGIKERIKNNDENATFVAAVQEICRSTINTFLNFKFNYATMSTAEKANMRRALGELMGITYGLIGGIAASCLLLAAEDDDDTLQFIGNLALYQSDRLSSETIMYNIGAISEFDKLWSSPVAIGSSFKDIFGSLGFVAEYIFNNEEFKPEYTTGQYRGENKLGVIIGRQIPIYRAIERLRRLDQNNKYYKLTENMLSIIPTKNIAEFIMNE